ncbi:mechanosensitive ion channel [Hahella sp. KA22]|uniref:mechanosensitive ion channel family protein n=1 Tax=Hahella sp. KA22 TaxID=1628392 RepID=UPI000FDF4AD6|nr:mechanosensitive ion channel family protein [Hahella sp. KA22]AZZ93260.1 mechanosensitive ion channel family protein [Hahella sp. KA22]QAY56634.1 mechanosensitive ion channel [Hahella sp. KA22]
MDIIEFEKAVDIVWSSIQEWAETALANLPSVIVALVFFFLFLYIAKAVSNLTQRVLVRSLDSVEVANLLSTIVHIVLVAIGIFVSLGFVGLQGTVTSLLAGAGIIGLALGFAFQDLTENFIAGIFMGVRKPFRVGDIVATADIMGTVEAINLRNTHILTFSGQRVILPNKAVFTNKLTNYSITRQRRLEIQVGISYADDIDKAAKVITKAIDALDFTRNGTETQVFATGFGDSSINLVVWYWIDYPTGKVDFMTAQHKGVVAVKKALDDADILIPFPIRTLDFAAKGGLQLDQIISTRAEEVESAA